MIKPCPWRLMQTIACTLLSAWLLSACAQLPAPAINLATPEWRVARGQALWEPPGAAKIAGDLLIALNTNGAVYIELSKSPVTLFRAQTTAQRWWLSTIDSGNHQGRGHPPTRFIWFFLPSLLTEKTPLPGRHWRINEQTPESLELTHVETGEHLYLLLDTPLQ